MINIQLYLNLYAYDKYTTLSQSIELFINNILLIFSNHDRKTKKGRSNRGKRTVKSLHCVYRSMWIYSHVILKFLFYIETKSTFDGLNKICCKSLNQFFSKQWQNRYFFCLPIISFNFFSFIFS